MGEVVVAEVVMAEAGGSEVAVVKVVVVEVVSVEGGERDRGASRAARMATTADEAGGRIKGLGMHLRIWGLF